VLPERVIDSVLVVPVPGRVTAHVRSELEWEVTVLDLPMRGNAT
jgi:hypothetical protein